MRVRTIGTWESEHSSVAQVEQALSGLRRGDQRAAVRTSVLTLIVVVTEEAHGRAALSVVDDLGGRSPSRAVVVVLQEADEGETVEAGAAGVTAPFSATAAIRAVEHGSVVTSFEEVVLRVRGRARYHLDSVVEPLVLPDVPAVVWLPSTLPSPGDPLLATADRIVVDSRAVAEEDGVDRRAVLPRIAALSHRLPVTDLSWVRLRSWRSLLAGLFDNPSHRPFLAGVDAVEVAGHYGPRHLLGGWLLRRLGLRDEQVSLSAAEHVSIRVEATHAGRVGTFAVERAGPHRVVDAWSEVEDEPPARQTVTLRRQWPALALAGALTRMGPDETYRASLAGALDLVARRAA